MALVGNVLELLRAGEGFFGSIQHRPEFCVLRVQFDEVPPVLRQFVSRIDRMRRAFVDAHRAVDALVGIDYNAVDPLVKARDRTYRRAFRVFALDARFGDNESHSLFSEDV